jgi:hypothetical protein
MGNGLRDTCPLIPQCDAGCASHAPQHHTGPRTTGLHLDYNETITIPFHLRVTALLMGLSSWRG